MWLIMNHYIATGAILFQDAVLYSYQCHLQAYCHLWQTQAPRYLVPVLVYTSGQ